MHSEYARCRYLHMYFSGSKDVYMGTEQTSNRVRREVRATIIRLQSSYILSCSSLGHSYATIDTYIGGYAVLQIALPRSSTLTQLLHPFPHHGGPSRAIPRTDIRTPPALVPLKTQPHPNSSHQRHHRRRHRWNMRPQSCFWRASTLV